MRDGLGLLLTLSEVKLLYTAFEGAVAELTVLTGFATSEVDLVAEFGRSVTSEGFYPCFSNLN